MFADVFFPHGSQQGIDQGVDQDIPIGMGDEPEGIGNPDTPYVESVPYFDSVQIIPDTGHDFQH
jgi:hypothetical protein